MAIRAGLALCALVLTLPACDSGDESDLAAASFTLQVGDGPARTYTQAAYFGEAAASEGMGAFSIVLGGREVAPSVTLSLLGERPATGSYRVEDAFGSVPELSAFLGIYIDPAQFSDEPDFEDFDLSGFFYARSGSVTLERVERREAVEGEYALTVQAVRVEGFDPEDPTGGNPTFEPTGEAFEVSGAFNAAFDADLFGGVEIPDTPFARQLAAPPGLIRLPGLSR